VSQVSAPAEIERLRKRQRLGWIVAGCSLFALIAAVAAVYLRPAPETRMVQFDVTLPGEITYRKAHSWRSNKNHAQQQLVSVARTST
jgi:hypothetical protein